jgi:hypothetical protein
MTEEKKTGRLRRRDFLAGSASLAVVAGAGWAGCSETVERPKDAGADGRPADRGAGTDAAKDGPASCNAPPQPLTPVTGASRVVEVQDPQFGAGSTIDAVRVKAGLREGLLALAGGTDIKQVWRTLLPDFAASMRIGIKVNCLSSYLYSSVPLVAALVETLVQDLGADATKIVVWDRRSDELQRSKLTEQALGVAVRGTVKSMTDASGPGYRTQADCALDRETRQSRVLTEETDITINLALLKTHTVSGMTGVLKNVYGCINNPGEFHTDLNHYLPAIYRLEPIRTKFRLHLTEALAAVIKGDTSDPPDNTPGRLLLALDPVALDAHVLGLTNQLRGTLPPLPPSKLLWIDEAARLNLGTRSVEAKVVSMP